MDNIETLMEMEPEKLMMQLTNEYFVKIPVAIESIDDMQEAGTLLGKCAAAYSYLASMALAAKLRKRKIKREGGNKQLVEDALSREEIFSNQAEMMKVTYNAISRMITVKQQINDELKMTEGR